MTFNFRHSTLGIGLLVIVITACTNLKKVSDFSSGSVSSLKKFEELDYSFVKACNEKCGLEQLAKQQIQKVECNCVAEKGADSVTLAIYQAIKGYFAGLLKLSDNELTNYRFTALTKAVTTGNFGEIKIDKEEVEAYGKISSVLTRSILDAYRKRKLSVYIAEANDAIKVLLNALEFNLVSNLSRRLDTKMQRLEGYYYDLSQANTSVYEKKRIIEEYTTAVNEIEVKKKELASFGKALRKIAEGHQQLFDHRNKLNDGELNVLLSGYASDLQDIIDEFNTIKNKN